MDANHTPDNHRPTFGTYRRTAPLSAAFGVRVREQRPLQEQEQQEQQQQDQMLPVRRSLEAGPP
jgi:hypothetical protein